MCIFCSPYHGVPYPWYEVHILARSYEKTRSNFGVYAKKWDADNSSRICKFLEHLSCNFENKTFLSVILVSMNRRGKDIKLTFASFGLHAGRFTVECRGYGNTLLSYFDIFIKVSSIFFLDSLITESLQCQIGLQLHTCFINFNLVKFRENWEKEFYLESMFWAKSTLLQTFCF